MTDGLKDTHRTAIVNLLRSNERVDRAVLFGSRATETFTLGSDVDIALFGEELTTTDQARLVAEMEKLKVPQKIDLLLYDQVEDAALREHVHREGVELYRRPNNAAARLHVPEDHSRTLVSLLLKHLPSVEVWAYGSRINGRSHDGSDLDLVLRGPGLEEIPIGQLVDFEEAIRASGIPFLVEARDWARLPERVHREIERGHMVLVEAQGEASRTQNHSAFAVDLIRFDQLAEINPSTQILKGDVRPFIEMADLRQHARDISSFSMRKFKGSGSRFKNGDTLIARITPCLENGKGALISCLPDRLAGFGSSEFIVARAQQSSDEKFVYYVTRSESFRKVAISQMEGTSGRQRVSWQQIANIEIPGLPPTLREKIGDILGVLDDKIALNRRMNETLEAMARAIYKDWFVDFGPTRARMEGRAPYLPPELWNLFPDTLDGKGKPVGWEEEPVYVQAHWVNGAAYKNMHFTDAPDALPVIKIAELKAGITKNTKFTNTALGDKFQIADGELLFSWSGNPDTSIDTFIWIGGGAWLNQHIFAVRENGKRSQPHLYAMLKWLKPEFSEIARNKQTTGLGHVTKQDLKRLLVPIGSPEVMTAFDELMKPICDRILGSLMEMRVLAQIRDLLIPKLMSGEIRLRNVEKTTEAMA